MSAGFVPIPLILPACQSIATLPTPTLLPNPMETPSPTSFTYGVTVLDEDNQPIADAQVMVEIESKAPLDEYTDAKGYARIIVPSTHAERPGRLLVNAKNYEVEIINIDIDLYQDRLPNAVRLTAQVVGSITGFCPDNLTFATGFDVASEDETLVVVSNFADTLGNDPRNVTFDLVERMAETLASHEKIRVERLNCAIKSSSKGAARPPCAPPEPEVRIYFDIVKGKKTYLGAGFDRSFGPQAIQASMFDFKASLGKQAGQGVDFVAGLALYNTNEHLATEPLTFYHGNRCCGSGAGRRICSCVALLSGNQLSSVPNRSTGRSCGATAIAARDR